MDDIELGEAQAAEPIDTSRDDDHESAAEDEESCPVRVEVPDLERPTESKKKRRGSEFSLMKRVIVLVVAITIAITFMVVVAVTVSRDGEVVTTGTKMTSGSFRRAAVAADVGICSEMGRDILKQGGGAVDAAITSLLCVGVVNPQSSGLGGGMFMLVYHKDMGKAEALMARERAPAAATANMTRETFGATSIAVPGELSGMWEAHQRYGRLPWGKLFQPVISLAEEGFPVTAHLARALSILSRRVANWTLPEHAGFLTRYANEDGTWKGVGETVYAPKLARTLRAIAMNGVSELINGTTAQRVVQEIQDYGGLITAADLADYKAEWREVNAAPIGQGRSVLTTPSPSGGPVVQFLINVLGNYKISSADFETTERQIKTYHRFVEASKFAFALRSYLGDVEAPEVQEVLDKMRSEEYAKTVFAKIREDAVTFANASGYDALLNTASHSGGTCHISVVDESGNAVSVTSSVNYYFGSMILSNTTGLILNNEMADFDTPSSQPASSANHVAPGKIPLSAMSPVIVVKENGGAELVVGSAGSRAIITTNALVALRSAFTDASLKDIIDDKRIHNQLQPNNVAVYENGFPTDVVDGLVNMGHVVESRTLISVAQAIKRSEDGWTAYSDPRKKGQAAGY
ncbi:gamma-glutamyltranspeptidase 1-like isoform X2 [Acanthaster planci]|nr:gamma-glutamyltranspeptidase 1-like isoform X2 [Acanthaster planci]